MTTSQPKIKPNNACMYNIGRHMVHAELFNAAVLNPADSTGHITMSHAPGRGRRTLTKTDNQAWKNKHSNKDHALMHASKINQSPSPHMMVSETTSSITLYNIHHPTQLEHLSPNTALLAKPCASTSIFPSSNGQWKASAWAWGRWAEEDGVVVPVFW